jgi:type IV fimbrial biogenesis protein FimT
MLYSKAQGEGNRIGVFLQNDAHVADFERLMRTLRCLHVVHGVQPMKHAQAGISLIELILTLAIVGILASISIPALGSLAHSAQSKTAGSAIANSLNFARMTAVNKQSNVVVCPSNDHVSCDGALRWESGWIVFEDADADGQRDADETLLEAVDHQPGIAIAATEGRKHVAFRADGSSPGTNLTLTLCDPKAASTGTVVVNNAGRVRTGTATAAQAAMVCGGA